jgi:hypothetical protein
MRKIFLTINYKADSPPRGIINVTEQFDKVSEALSRSGTTPAGGDYFPNVTGEGADLPSDTVVFELYYRTDLGLEEFKEYASEILPSKDGNGLLFQYFTASIDEDAEIEEQEA